MDAPIKLLMLENAIENMADGFALFDAEDCFVLCNENYRNILSGIADHLVPGTSFEDMTRAFAERGLIAVEADHIDDWFRIRVSQHRGRRFPQTSIQRRPLDPLGRAPDKRRGPSLYPYRHHRSQAGRGPDRASRTARRPHRADDEGRKEPHQAPSPGPAKACERTHEQGNS